MSPQVTVDLSEIEQWAEKLAGPLGRQAAIEEISTTMRITIDAVEQAIVPRIPEGATGNLRGSAATNIHGQPLATYTGELTIGAPYGLAVEHGRAPGRQPPSGPIELWVMRKLGLDGDEAKQVAFLIARAIGRRGTKPGARFVEQGWEAAQPKVMAYWDGLPERLTLRWSKL